MVGEIVANIENRVRKGERAWAWAAELQRQIQGELVAAGEAERLKVEQERRRNLRDIHGQTRPANRRRTAK
ncbi:MAG: hypothetical protein OXH14_08170 [Alphaproteobacteria bacterium]|nr:hypothetical protein [Alphaproteobacteria bacterium]